MEKQFNGNRSKFAKEDLRMLDDIANLDIDYCKCEEKQDPDYAFCDKCEKPIPGVDESLVKSVVAITGQFNFLKSK